MPTYGLITKQCGTVEFRTGVFGESYITRTGSFTGNSISMFFPVMHTVSSLKLNNLSYVTFIRSGESPWCHLSDSVDLLQFGLCSSSCVVHSINNFKTIRPRPKLKISLFPLTRSKSGRLNCFFTTFKIHLKKKETLFYPKLF